MADVNKVDLGEIQIHKKVIGDIAACSLSEIPGVRLARFGLMGLLCDAVGYTHFPGVMVSLGKRGEIKVEIRVIVDFGIHIPDIAQKIQDVIHAAVEDALGIDLDDIDVKIHAVERRGESCG